jgi:hypothetical protein
MKAALRMMAFKYTVWNLFEELALLEARSIAWYLVLWVKALTRHTHSLL